MTTYTNLHALLSARPVALWVEDMLTKEYLQRIWQPDDIFFQILVAGTNDSVTAVVRDLQENGYGNVFGLTDRYASADVMDTDLAKSVADWQINNNSVPNELIVLKDSIKTRVSMPSYY